MPAVISYKFRVHNAEQFKEALDEPANSVIYFYIGGVSPYANELSPPSPGSSVANTEFVPWRDMIAAKRLFGNDVSHVVKRHNWSSGIVYSQYDDQIVNLTTDNFYVLTDEYNVYKCLFNNSGVVSTSKPTGTSTSSITTADGYVWKYMYTISTGDALKFLTASHIPVKTLSTDDGSNQWNVQQAAVPGAIDIIKVTSAGAGYTSTPTVQIVGDGANATATAIVSSNTISAISVNTRGTGYTTASVVISGGGASVNATATAIISPPGGHGSDPIEELGGIYLLMNVRLDGTESSTFAVGNEFRKIGLIRDPHEYGTSTRSTSPLARQTFKYTITSVTSLGFSVDDVVTTANGSATVVSYDSANSFLYTTLPVPTPFQVGDTIVGPSGTGSISVINTPGLKPYTGDIIYMENRTAIERTSDQVEDIKLIIEY